MLLELRLGSSAARLLFFEKENDRSRNIDRRVDPDDHPDEHGKGEVADDIPPENVEGDDAKDSDPRGHDRPGEGVVDAAVDDPVELGVGMAGHVFADAVANDNRVERGASERSSNADRFDRRKRRRDA